MPRRVRYILLAVLCLVGPDFSFGQRNNVAGIAPKTFGNETRDSVEVEGSGVGRLPYSDDEDFVEEESGSGVEESGSGYIPEETNVDIIIDEITPGRRPKPSTTSKTTTTTTTRPLSGCENVRKTSKRLVGHYVPSCLPNGDYAPLQCQGFPGKDDCWCSDLNGREIPGTMMEAPSFPDCDGGDNLSPCYHQLVKYTRNKLLGSFRPRCSLDGNFEQKQCLASVCYCVDEKTGRKKIGTEVNVPDIPNCDDESGDVVIETTTPYRKPIHPIHRGEDKEDGIDIDENTEYVYPKVDTGLEATKDRDKSLDLDIDTKIDVDDDYDSEKPDDETNETGHDNNDEIATKKQNMVEEASEIMTQPGILAGIIGGAVVLLLCLVLLVMFIVYRMKKKDEGSYPLDEPHKRTPNYSYVRAPEREFYA